MKTESRHIKSSENPQLAPELVDPYFICFVCQVEWLLNSSTHSFVTVSAASGGVILFYYRNWFQLWKTNTHFMLLSSTSKSILHCLTTICDYAFIRVARYLFLEHDSSNLTGLVHFFSTVGSKRTVFSLYFYGIISFFFLFFYCQ